MNKCRVLCFCLDFSLHLLAFSRLIGKPFKTTITTTKKLELELDMFISLKRPYVRMYDMEK